MSAKAGREHQVISPITLKAEVVAYFLSWEGAIGKQESVEKVAASDFTSCLTPGLEQSIMCRLGVK